MSANRPAHVIESRAVSGFDWQRAKQREHDGAEADRLRKLGIEHGGPPAPAKSKRVHPNSTAARKWKRTDWRTR
jgi:hypothetical protein